MRRSIGATLWLLLLAGWAGAAAARQDAHPPAVPGPDVPAAGTALADAATAERVTTLGEVRAVAPDEDVDLYRFRNPVQVPPNRFDRAYRPPPAWSPRASTSSAAGRRRSSPPSPARRRN